MMNLRVRFAVWFSLAVAFILSVTYSITYLESAKFREQEFFERLQKKALTTQRLLTDVQEVDSSLLKIIDRNTLTTLSDIRVLVFGDQNRLFYNSVDNDTTRINYTLVEETRREQRIKYLDPKTHYQIIGLLVISTRGPYVVMASAYDRQGFDKLANLGQILLLTWILGLAITILLAYIYVRFVVGKPLANLTSEIGAIGEHDLTKRIPVYQNQNELTTLAQNFNDLLARLEQAFESQRNFIQYASHELRTPMANMLSVTENALSLDRSPGIYRETLRSLREEQSRLVELTNSLLVLSQYEKINQLDSAPHVRIDEVLYNTIEELRTIYPEYRLKLDFIEIPEYETDLEVKGNEALLRTAFRNLLENACRYSTNYNAEIHIKSDPAMLLIYFDNHGAVLTEAESRHLFTPFFRGGNASGKRGYGIGLVMAQRILKIHQARITYDNPGPDLNRFIIQFKKQVV
jgi:signal transduction histidine kinase